MQKQPAQPNDTQYDFNSQEISKVADFIHRRNTAVITTMFTDIKGFTELTEKKGDSYAQSLRQIHDELIKKIIEKDDHGTIVKYIGDAVMAIFSEPSTAVQCAIQIQRQLAEFNQKNADFEKLSVRIGLHMGQIAVEQRMQTDVFGRHVNRASRVESLADGGQIFVTYPVFDSAKGWLENDAKLDWKLHGAWTVKGIDEPIAIYEVYDPTLQQPKAPRHGQKKRTFPKSLTSLALVFAGVLATSGWFYYEKTEVWLVRFYPERAFIDEDTPVLLEGKKEDELRKTAQPIAPGHHVLHFDTSGYSRFFAEIEVKRGKNYIEPIFKQVYLPSIFLRQTYHTPKPEETITQQYTLFGKNGLKKTYNTELRLNIQSQKQTKELVVHTLHYQIIINDQTVKTDTLAITHNPNFSEIVKTPYVTMWEDELHQFTLFYYLTGDYIDASLQGQFISN